uniref:Ras-associating domain-containing protein n=3 Tax=Cyprinodon variegatus TaxID=28743 RepID=A0A3Q2FCM5_CYPVA
MEEMWRDARWIMDALQYARYKQPTGGISISWIIDFSKEVLPDKPPSTSSQPDFMPSPMPSPEPCRKHSDYPGLSDEEGSSEVFLTTDSDYDSSRAQSPRELDLLPPSPLSSTAPLEPRGFLRSDGSGSGGVLCPSGGGRGGGALRDSTPDVLQASEPQLGRESERCGGGGRAVRCGGERRRGPPELFDSDFILPSRQIELLHITEKRQAFCVRTSSLEFPSTTSIHNQPYSDYSHYSSPSTSPQSRWHRPSSVDRCPGERCVLQLPPARTLSEDSGTQKLNSPSPAAFRIGCHATLRVYPQYRTGLPKETSVKLCVTLGTTAREMIQLVVQEMNTISRRLLGSNGGGEEQEKCVYYGPEQLKHFGLVLVVDNREKWLQDDFCPLELQNPWLRGKLCVRIKDYSPLALKHSRATTV